jgi:hypothetical protein
MNIPFSAAEARRMVKERNSTEITTQLQFIYTSIRISASLGKDNITHPIEGVIRYRLTIEVISDSLREQGYKVQEFSMRDGVPYHHFKISW